MQEYLLLPLTTILTFARLQPVLKGILHNINTSRWLLVLVFLLTIIFQHAFADKPGPGGKPGAKSVFTPDKKMPLGLNEKSGAPLQSNELAEMQGTYGLSHNTCNVTNWSRSSGVPMTQATWTILSDCNSLSNSCKGAWISKDATYTTGKDRSGPPLPSLLTDNGPLYSRTNITDEIQLAKDGPVNDYAFYADKSAPYIIIDLGSIKKIDQAYILNRRNPQHWSSLQNLKISLSQSGKTYKTAWEHKPVEPIKLSFDDKYFRIPDINASWKLQPARYIKIEKPVDDSGLALRRVYIYNSTQKKILDASVERKPRTWTSTSGSTIEAALVQESGRLLILKRKDGSVVKIPIIKLSKKDRAHITELKNQP